MERHFLVGSYAQAGTASLFRVILDTQTGALRCAWACGDAENPSWVLLHPGGALLYAVEERVPEGRLAVFARDGDGWALRKRFPAGSAPCHLALDDRARFLFVSNYMDGTLDVWALDETGMPRTRTDRIRHEGHGPNAERQEGPHIHSALVLDELIYVADLGLDRVAVYRLNRETGRLAPETILGFPAGCGPRHTCAVPGHPALLRINAELGGQVFTVNRFTGEILQTRRALPADFAELFRVSAIRQAGDTVYTGCRECECVALFPAGLDGLLGEPAYHMHDRKTPRDVWMDETWCLTADEGSGGVSLLRREGLRLRPAAFLPLAPAQPTCVVPLK